ncbi:MAG: hypothetical protein ACRDT1_12870, partial [Micromonosporaceae bacterium]
MNTGRTATTLIAALGLLLIAPPADASGRGVSYQGVEHHHGGTVTPIAGPVPEVDTLADEITRSSKAMLGDLARERAKLRHGGADMPSDERQLDTYPPPEGAVPSDQYAVTLQQADVARSSFTHKVTARKTDTNLEEDTSWTSFSFGGAVTVSVRKLE